MIRLEARYQIVAGDFPALDSASDALLDALHGNPDVLDADVAVSMTEPTLEVWFAVPTDDAMHALVVATHVLEAAFAKAGLTSESFKVATRDAAVPLLGRADLHAEAVPA
ncbi:MAG: hypothetical protein ACRD6W_05715 [Nitrososphaerales archaeon]